MPFLSTGGLLYNLQLKHWKLGGKNYKANQSISFFIIYGEISFSSFIEGGDGEIREIKNVCVVAVYVWYLCVVAVHCICMAFVYCFSICMVFVCWTIFNGWFWHENLRFSKMEIVLLSNENFRFSKCFIILNKNGFFNKQKYIVFIKKNIQKFTYFYMKKHSAFLQYFW